MTLLETFRSAFTALLLNKVRSFLTMLGVIIGVFSVVVLVSLVRGFQNYITDQFNALGSNLIIIAPGNAGASGDPSRIFTNNKLAEKHVEMLETQMVDKVVGVSPSLRVAKLVKYKSKSYSSTLGAGNSMLDKLLDIVVEEGRFFNKADVDAKAHVIVLGSEVAKELFSGRNPLKERVKIGNATFTVIGVAKSKGANFDDRVFIPYTTAKDALGIAKYSSIFMKAKDATEMDLIMKQARYVLLRDLKKDEFSVISQKDILASIQSILGVLSLGLGAVAAISLLVGGIGIMNIMLVSVTERTQEIGLRKALGATGFNIASQFLIESVFISLIGGVIGLGLAYSVTFAVQSFLRAQVPLWAVIVALGFSSLVGIVFGTYPAIFAGKKNPIDALRFE